MLFNSLLKVLAALALLGLDCYPIEAGKKESSLYEPIPEILISTAKVKQPFYEVENFMMNNFDPSEWQYVSVDLNKVEDLAKILVTNNDLILANWSEIFPQELTLNERIEYIMGLICIDFCHWDLKSAQGEVHVRDFYAKDFLGNNVRGSAAMTALASEGYNKGFKIFEATFMSGVTVDALRPHFMGLDAEGNLMEIPWLEERVKIMNEIGQILLEKWDGSFCNVLSEAKGRAFNNGTGYVELLVRDFPRFKDEYTYKGKKIGIYKLAQLSVMALQNSLSQYSDFISFKDCDSLTLCADYQLPKSLRALEILKYGSELKTHIDNGKLIPSGSQLEIELRMATLFAGYQLKNVTNAILTREGKPPITSRELDYFLWSYGRQLNPSLYRHHLTRTIMY